MYSAHKNLILHALTVRYKKEFVYVSSFKQKDIRIALKIVNSAEFILPEGLFLQYLLGVQPNPEIIRKCLENTYR